MTALKRANIKVTGVEKFVSAGSRKIRGTATTGSLDLVGDIVAPEGGKWKLPLSLLWQHDPGSPIGWVRSINRSGNGLTIEAEIASGLGKCDEAWSMIDAGLVNGFSIGFVVNKHEPLPGGGRKYTDWTLTEISVVTIPCNQDARIQRHVGSVRLIRPSNAIRLVRPSVERHVGAVRLVRPSNAIPLSKTRKS
ncbi:MAG: hypothetical protein HPY82_08380 [Gammaproteobacteria bacterium]|nr:hypothetical protein [Gammaproteobacteria bacterium]